jgi:hypothetical protein
LKLSWTRVVTASSLSCQPIPRGLVCTSGDFATGEWFPKLPPTGQTYHVIAYDYGTGKWSNWAIQPII